MNLAMGGTAIAENASFFKSQLRFIKKEKLKAVIIAVPFIRFCDTIPVNRIENAAKTYSSKLEYYQDNYIFKTSMDSVPLLFEKSATDDGSVKIVQTSESEKSTSLSKKERFALVKQFSLAFKELSFAEQAEYLHLDCSTQVIDGEIKKLESFVAYLKEQKLKVIFWNPPTRGEMVEFTLNSPFKKEYLKISDWLKSHGAFFDFFINKATYGIKEDFFDILHTKNKQNHQLILDLTTRAALN